jgi:hypothetical protein
MLAVIPGWSEGPDPESRDSGFDASHRPGMTNVTVIARSAATKQSILSSRRDGLLRFARNDEKSRLICPTGKSLRLSISSLSTPF